MLVKFMSGFENVHTSIAKFKSIYYDEGIGGAVISLHGLVDIAFACTENEYENYVEWLTERMRGEDPVIDLPGKFVDCDWDDEASYQSIQKYLGEYKDSNQISFRVNGVGMMKDIWNRTN